MDKENYQLGNIIKYKDEIVEITKELLGRYYLDQLDEPFVPIEINTEWLYRLGFRNFDGHIFTILNKAIYVSKLDLEYLGLWLLGSPKLSQLGLQIKYVHEIQNAVSHLNETSIGININTEIEILGAKLLNLSPIEQQIEILKKQIELYHYAYGSYNEMFKAQQYELLATLENLRLRKLKKK